VKFTLRDGRTVCNPSEADLEMLFASLADAGDFIILNDANRGEMRAAGRRDGTFLLQCDLPRDGRVFAGELPQVGFAEALGMYREFRAGSVDWSRRFASRGEPLSRGAKVTFLVAVAALAALLLWWCARSA
jgi:hypothetical protein